MEKKEEIKLEFFKKFGNESFRGYPLEQCQSIWEFFEKYVQCQEDNDWTKDCKCESSIGQTWCCNHCGLPYDTRKSNKKYTEEDMAEVQIANKKINTK